MGFLASCIFIVGCSATDSVKDVGAQIPGGNNNQNLISENEEVKLEEIELSDYSITKLDTGYIYNLFGNINDAQYHLGSFSPEIIYDHPHGQEFSIIAQKWSSLYIEWIKGNGVILKIIVEEKGYETQRGIGIGDSISDIDKAYGPETGYRSKTEIEFDLGNEEYETVMALIFHLENEVVVKIEIMQGT